MEFARSTMDLQGVGLFEKDAFGSIMCSWSYPSLPEGFESVLQSRSLLDDDSALPTGAPRFVWSRFKSLWHYSMIADADPKVDGKVECFSISVLSGNFNPEKFGALLQLWCAQYTATGTPTSILEGYLKAFTTAQFACPAGSWAAASFGDNRALISGCSLRDVLRSFGPQAVLLWNAMLLKKRIVVFCDVLPELLAFVRAMPQLVWHRQRWQILRPFVAASKAQLDELGAAGVYVAGFTEKAVRSGEQYYDVFVDLPERRVAVAAHAKAGLAMGEFHKGLAEHMLALANADGATDQAVIKGVALKTKELLDNLRGMCTATAAASDGSGGARNVVTREILAARKMPASMERFLFDVALAEDMA